MMVKTTWLRVWACMLVFVFAMGTISLPVGVMAQTTQKKNIAQRHPNATGVVAGIAAYKIAKKTGKNRAAQGGKRNFAQRHPVLTGLAAGWAARKAAKSTGKNKR